jgi:hypothetical protein
MPAGLKTVRPNDLHPGDVLLHEYSGGVLLVVEVSAEEKRVDSVILVQSQYAKTTPGTRLSTTYTSKGWKGFTTDYSYVSRGWANVLCPERGSEAESDMIQR